MAKIWLQSQRQTSNIYETGLDYINKYLLPTNTDIIERIKVFSDVYADRTRRAFTGSKWIIGCSAAVGVLFVWSGGITTFIFIHFLGLLFYILSSRTSFYTIEKGCLDLVAVLEY